MSSLRDGKGIARLDSLACTTGSAVFWGILHSITRDGRFFGPLSKPFGALHPHFKTPVVATLFNPGKP